jgi:hypothetical protein
MQKVATYREHAAQCRRLASHMPTPEHRQQLLEMAEIWEALADEREQDLLKDLSRPLT